MNRENIYQTLNQKEILETQELKAFIYRILKLIEEDIDTFTMTKDYTYFLLTIPYLYKISTFNDSEKKNITLKLQSIRGKIQKILKEKKVNNETKNNYKILKKFNGKIEIVSLSLINSYDENFQEYKQDLIYYLIFSIKNIQVLKNILKKAPHQINILDKNGLLIIEKVVDSFLESLLYHVKEEDYKNLDDVIYYDRVLEILLTHNKEYINKYHIKK